MGGPTESRLPVLVSLIGILLLAVSGWLGGEMVFVHGVAAAPERRNP